MLSRLAVLTHPLPEGGDVDQRHIEDCIGGLDEAEAIAAGYTPLAEHLGWPPMPDIWWLLAGDADARTRAPAPAGAITARGGHFRARASL